PAHDHPPPTQTAPPPATPAGHPKRGRRSFQGCATSSCDASRNSVASSPKRATSCTPSGRPLRDIASGTDIAGWPDELKSDVKPIEALRAALNVAVSGFDRLSGPSGYGGWAIVGVMRAS